MGSLEQLIADLVSRDESAEKVAPPAPALPMALSLEALLGPSTPEVVPPPQAPEPEPKPEEPHTASPIPQGNGRTIVIPSRSTQRPELDSKPITVYAFRTDPTFQPGKLVALNNTFMCYGIRSGRIRIIDIVSKSRGLLRGHWDSIVDMSFVSFDSPVLATVAKDGQAFLWRLRSEDVAKLGDKPSKEDVAPLILLQASHPMSGQHYTRLAWQPEGGAKLAVAGSSGCLALWDVPTMSSHGAAESQRIGSPWPMHSGKGIGVVELVAPGGPVSGHDVVDIAWAPGSGLLVAGIEDGHINVWRLDADGGLGATAIAQLTPHRGWPISYVGFSGDRLVSGAAWNSEVALWPPMTKQCDETYAPVHTITFSATDTTTDDASSMAGAVTASDGLFSGSDLVDELERRKSLYQTHASISSNGLYMILGNALNGSLHVLTVGEDSFTRLADYVSIPPISVIAIPSTLESLIDKNDEEYDGLALLVVHPNVLHHYTLAGHLLCADATPEPPAKPMLMSPSEIVRIRQSTSHASDADDEGGVTVSASEEEGRARMIPKLNLGRVPTNQQSPPQPLSRGSTEPNDTPTTKERVDGPASTGGSAASSEESNGPTGGETEPEAVVPHPSVRSSGQRRGTPQPKPQPVPSIEDEEEPAAPVVVDQAMLEALFVKLDTAAQKRSEAIHNRISLLETRLQKDIAKEVVPIVKQTLKESLDGGKLITPLIAQLKNSLHQLLPPLVKQLVSKAITKETSTLVASELSAALKEPIRSALTESFSGLVIPGVERALQKALTQAEASLRATLADQKSTFTATAREASKSGQEVIVKHVHQAIEDALSKWQPPQSSTTDVRPLVESLVNADRLEEAFTKVLDSKDVSLVLWLLERVDVNKVFRVNPPALSSYVMVALVQQLGTELEDALEVKLMWLRECVLCIDPKDPPLASLLPNVLRGLLKALNDAFPRHSDPRDPTSGDFKLLMHVVNSLLR